MTLAFGVSVVLWAAFMPLTAQQPEWYEALTVPVGTLPEGCRLKPPTPSGAFLPSGANPLVTKEPVALNFMMLFLKEPTEEEEQEAAGIFAIKDRRERRVATKKMARAHVADVDAGYGAFYEEDGGAKEIGVYALRFKEPISEADQERFKEGVVVRGQVAILMWADGDSPACFDIVRRHVATVDLSPVGIELDSARIEELRDPRLELSTAARSQLSR